MGTAAATLEGPHKLGLFYCLTVLPRVSALGLYRAVYCLCTGTTLGILLSTDVAEASGTAVIRH